MTMHQLHTFESAFSGIRSCCEGVGKACDATKSLRSHFGKMSSSSSSCHLDFKSFVSRVARSGQSLSSTEVRHLRRLCEVCKDFLKDRWRSLIAPHAAEPALVSYSCDSTPLVTRESFRKEWGVGEKLRVTRRGRQLGHYDVQRCWFRSGGEVGVLFSEPLLLEDQTAKTHMTAYLELVGYARSLGHRGLLISHHVEDRALVGPMSKLFRMYLASVDAEQASGSSTIERDLLRLMHWKVSSGCICHDVHNGMKLGQLQTFETETIKSSYVTVEALRNSFSPAGEEPSYLAPGGPRVPGQ